MDRDGERDLSDPPAIDDAKWRTAELERRADLEDILALIADQPGKAAWVMEELFKDVIWNHEHRGESELDDELTPEQRLREEQAWHAGMADFWRRLDGLTRLYAAYRDRPDSGFVP